MRLLITAFYLTTSLTLLYTVVSLSGESVSFDFGLSVSGAAAGSYAYLAYEKLKEVWE